MRASLLKRENYWVVIDSQYDTVVLTTENRKIAAHWQMIVNGCRHERPYDILWHSFKINKN